MSKQVWLKTFDPKTFQRNSKKIGKRGRERRGREGERNEGK